MAKEKKAIGYNKVRKEASGDPIDGFRELGEAIIRQATKDYISAVTSPDSDDARTVKEYAESFFKSEYFKIYSLGADGEAYLDDLDWQIRHGSDFAGDNESVERIAKQVREIENPYKRVTKEELEENEDEIREFAELGQTLDEIAKRMNCPPRRISKFAKSHNIPIKGMWNPDETKRRRNGSHNPDGREM